MKCFEKRSEQTVNLNCMQSSSAQEWAHADVVTRIEPLSRCSAGHMLSTAQQSAGVLGLQAQHSISAERYAAVQHHSAHALRRKGQASFCGKHAGRSSSVRWFGVKRRHCCRHHWQGLEHQIPDIAAEVSMFSMAALRCNVGATQTRLARAAEERWPSTAQQAAARREVGPRFARPEFTDPTQRN